jgi:hypothetical protein
MRKRTLIHARPALVLPPPAQFISADANAVTEAEGIDAD